MNVNTGKMSEVEVNYDKYIPDSFEIYADPGKLKIISKVPGVARVILYVGFETRYHVDLDKRYDWKVVRSNIIKAITNKEN